ncbi:MAG: synaptobrevin family protein [Asgard group archaeon]|nr:synaptobrevin family protein [Asgard group archaeon]
MIHCTLTINSTTLYTYENHNLVHLINNNNINCSEVVSQELGLINASRTLVGSIPISTTNSIKLAMYFMKKVLSNLDGSRDLITVVSIAHINVNKTMILNVMKNIMDKYIDYKREVEANKSGPNDPLAKSKLGEFKLYMNQIIKYEEMSYDSNHHLYSYGSVSEDNEEGSSSHDQINPNQLLLANEEVDEVRQLMLDNINKLLSRGDKINSLVDQTDRLNTSSLVFQKRAQQIKRKMWFMKAKFILYISGGILMILYLFIGSQCGFPIFDHCIRN